MTRNVKRYIADIANTIKDVEEFMKSFSFNDYSRNTQAIQAVTMESIVISEAAKHLPA